MNTENIHHPFRFSDLLLLFCIITIREILRMIHFFLNVLYEDYNPLAQHFKNKNRFLELFSAVFDNYLKITEKDL